MKGFVAFAGFLAIEASSSWFRRFAKNETSNPRIDPKSAASHSSLHCFPIPYAVGQETNVNDMDILEGLDLDKLFVDVPFQDTDG